MFEDLNLPFHGVLQDPLIEDSYGPLIEDSYGPLINCDFYSTFDETSPFIASPSSAIFNGEYQLTISSNTTSLLTYNFQMEGLKHLYHFCSKEYPMKIHLSTFGSSFDLFSSGTCTYVMQPNILRCETSSFLLVNFFFKCHAMNYHCGCLIHDIDYSYYRFSPKIIWKILLIQHGTCYFYNVPILPFSNFILLWGIIT